MPKQDFCRDTWTNRVEIRGVMLQPNPYPRKGLVPAFLFVCANTYGVDVFPAYHPAAFKQVLLKVGGGEGEGYLALFYHDDGKATMMAISTTDSIACFHPGAIKTKNIVMVTTINMISLLIGESDLKCELLRCSVSMLSTSMNNGVETHVS